MESPNHVCCYEARTADRTKHVSRHQPSRSSRSSSRGSCHSTTVRLSTSKLHTFLLVACLLLLSHTVLAYPQLDRRKTGGPLAIDYSKPPTPRSATIPVADVELDVLHLDRRQQYGDLTPREPGNSGGILTDGAPSSSIPEAFDTNMGNNYTDPQCDGFFNRMLADLHFKNCLPVSLLLQTSNSFFQATKSIVTLTKLLENACSVDFNTCSSIMDSYATQIVGSDACEQDYDLRNPTVTQALNGLLAYSPIHEATCRKDNNTNNYCYAEAVADKKNPTTGYVYYLPLGVSLPSGAMPRCNDCMQQTMSGFATFASNSTQPISRTYSTAAQQFDVVCGPTFARKNILVTSAATFVYSPSWLFGIVALAAWWLACP